MAKLVFLDDAHWMWRFIHGKGEDRNGKPIAWADWPAMNHEAEQAANKLFGGWTRLDSKGGWTNDAGQSVVELGQVWEVVADGLSWAADGKIQWTSPEKIGQFAAVLLAVYRQASVVVIAPDRRVKFVTLADVEPAPAPRPIADRFLCGGGNHAVVVPDPKSVDPKHSRGS